MESTRPDEPATPDSPAGQASPAEGSRTFQVAADAYDAYMGRYSRRLAAPFVDRLVAGSDGSTDRLRALDVGCGPGALTGELVRRLGADRVAACDPSPPFVEACRARHPGVDVRPGPAEALPFDDGAFDVVAAQLILHFVSDADRSVQEMVRVASPGGTVGAVQWATDGGMELIRRFWEAALVHDPDAPVETHLRFGAPGELRTLFEANGLVDVVEDELVVSERYANVDELWATYLLGVGPAGVYAHALPTEQQQAVRAEFVHRLGDPDGEVVLEALARTVRGTTPR